jgi:predicted metalloprotease with PDZ domain
MRILSLLLGAIATLSAADPLVSFDLDLTNRSDDSFHVVCTINTPPSGPVVFHMAATVPGTYEVQNWGKAVLAFNAYASDGSELAVEHSDTNTWSIAEGARLARLVYRVDDSLDSDAVSTWAMADTDFSDDGATIQPFGVFGWFDHLREAQYQATYRLPSGWTMASALDLVPVEGGMQSVATDFDTFVDAPLLAGALDSTMVTIGGCEVVIARSSPLGELSPMTSAILRREIEPILKATETFLGHLPAKRYAFLMRGADRSLEQCGALEHLTSSFYYMPDITPASEIAHMAAHEFFHIVTPLNIRSEIIAHFNFATPTPSQHLWLYEGVTEYCAHLISVRGGLIDEITFANRLRSKFSEAAPHQWDLPLTELSLGCYGEHHPEYVNIYAKGALVACAFDLALRRQRPEHGLRELLLDLLANYSAKKPFSEDTFLADLVARTSPDIQDFIDRHIRGGEMPDYAELFALVGYEFVADGGPWINTRWPTLIPLDDGGIGLWADTGMPLPRGFTAADRVIAVDGSAVASTHLPALAKNAAALQDRDIVTFTVHRLDGDHEIKLRAKAGNDQGPYRLRSLPVLTAEQFARRRAWLLTN